MKCNPFHRADAGFKALEMQIKINRLGC